MKKIGLLLVNMHPEFYPNLGLGYLASYLKKYSPYSVDVRILEGHKDIARKIREISPDIVGFTASSCYFPENVHNARTLRQFFKGPIILGGPHITSLPSSLPLEMDIGIIGEGEQTLCELLQIFYQKGSLENLQSVKGICFHENGAVKLTQGRELIDPLDKIPFPDRNLFDMGTYFKPQNILENYEYLRGTSIITSRGCPYRCIYCQPKTMWQKIRMHSAEYVVEEIKFLYDAYKIEAIVVVDDLFILNKKRIKDVVEGLLKNGILGKIKFRIQGRANLIDEELMRILKELNTVQIDIGLESGNDRVLRYLKGNSVSMEDNIRAIGLAGKYGMGVYGLVMIGSPKETREEMMDTLRLIKDPRINTVAISKTIPLPGTKLWKEVQGDRFITKLDDWRKLDTSLEKGDIYLNENVPYAEFMEIYKQFKKTADGKRIKNTFSHLSIRYFLKAAVSPEKLLRFIQLLANKFLDFLGFTRKKDGIRDSNPEQEGKLNIVYFLEKDFNIVPQRPHLEALGKYCNLICVNPPVSVDTFFRNPRKFLNWLKDGKLEKCAYLVICKPFALTSYGISDRLPFFKVINRWFVGKFVNRSICQLGLSRIIWQITYPQQDYLIGLFGNDPMFYSVRDLVDTSSELERLSEGENSIIQKARLVFASSEVLYQEKKTINPNTFYVPNGADLKHFSIAKKNTPKDISFIQRPRIGYSGAINDMLDVELLIKIAKRQPEWSIVLVGFKDYTKAKQENLIRRLFGMPNVYYLGRKSYEDLPEYINEFDICLAPYLKCRWVECSFPNKIVQYLAMGKPVVSFDFPAARLFKEVIRVCENHDEFIAAVENYIANPGDRQIKVDFAKKYDASRLAFEKIKILETAFLGERV